MAESKKCEDLASVEPSSNAQIEGIVTFISPMKAGKSCDYYDGRISDDNSSLRFCGFSSSARRKLEECYESNEPVLLSGCEIKKSRQTDGLEIVVKTRTKISKSQRSFEISKDNGSVMALEKVQDLPQYRQVHVQAKAMHVGEVVELRYGGKVQEVVIADNTGHVTLNIWGNHIGKVEEGCSYDMKGLMVKEYRDNKSLSTPKENFHIEKIDEIGGVIDNYADNEKPLEIQLIEDVRVYAIEKLDNYYSCVNCKGKVMGADEDGIAECTKCGTTQLITECRQAIVAQLRLKSAKGEKFCLTAFDAIVVNIAERPADQITKKAIIKAEKFNMKFSNGVIYYVERH